MELTRGVLVILVSWSFVSPVTSINIKLHCEEYDEIPPISEDSAPSTLADLKASLVWIEEERRNMLNISWALNNDNTLKYVEGIHIRHTEDIRCTYIPHLAMADFKEDNQIWFHHLTNVFSADVWHIQAANLPLPPPENGLAYKSVIIYASRKSAPAVPEPEVTTTVYFTTSAPVPGKISYEVSVVGGLICLMVLLSCYVIYKSCGARFALGFKRVATSPTVPVLVVYPAEDSAFQWAVVALAEFLQQHGSCSVAIDMWQQGNIAKLGPMRWLVEQVKAAEQVLIVCPQPHHSPPMETISGASIPAAAQDLYPLALNLVASQAKNCSELAKFWVVQLGEKPSNLAPELEACRRFCLMKDVNKLCRCLQSQRQENTKNISNLFFRSWNFSSGNSTEKLHAAVRTLNGQQIA